MSKEPGHFELKGSVTAYFSDAKIIQQMQADNERRMRAALMDPVLRALDKLRSNAEPARRPLHKAQQYAYLYGASPRQLHLMARHWNEISVVVEASQFSHKYSMGPTTRLRSIKPTSNTERWKGNGK